MRFTGLVIEKLFDLPLDRRLLGDLIGAAVDLFKIDLGEGRPLLFQEQFNRVSIFLHSIGSRSGSFTISET
ncbi:MAG: hypothetical protein HYY44_08350 [Deltaproteobacteria bacterium]|nr:hypothetical protein [Deltaproteobacteria bacterium]